MPVGGGDERAALEGELQRAGTIMLMDRATFYNGGADGRSLLRRSRARRASRWAALVAAAAIWVAALVVERTRSAPTWRRRARGCRPRWPAQFAALGEPARPGGARRHARRRHACGWPSSGDAAADARAVRPGGRRRAPRAEPASPSRSTAPRNQPVAWVGRSEDVPDARLTGPGVAVPRAEHAGPAAGPRPAGRRCRRPGAPHRRDRRRGAAVARRPARRSPARDFALDDQHCAGVAAAAVRRRGRRRPGRVHHPDADRRAAGGGRACPMRDLQARAPAHSRPARRRRARAGRAAAAAVRAVRCSTGGAPTRSIAAAAGPHAGDRAAAGRRARRRCGSRSAASVSPTPALTPSAPWTPWSGVAAGVADRLPADRPDRRSAWWRWRRRASRMWRVGPSARASASWWSIGRGSGALFLAVQLAAGVAVAALVIWLRVVPAHARLAGAGRHPAVRDRSAATGCGCSWSSA